MGVRAVELLIVKDFPSHKDKGCGTRLRVVQWVYDKKEGGQGSVVKLEKRQYYLHTDGTERVGKAEGFGMGDLECCKPVWQDIIKLMKNPPEIKAETPTTVAPGNEIEEIPF